MKNDRVGNESEVMISSIVAHLIITLLRLSVLFNAFFDIAVLFSCYSFFECCAKELEILIPHTQFTPLLTPRPWIIKGFFFLGRLVTSSCSSPPTHPRPAPPRPTTLSSRHPLLQTSCSNGIRNRHTS